MFQGNATFRLPLSQSSVLTNAPYSGQQTNQLSQTLADGTHITRTLGMNQKAWRDSQGRVRMERSFVSMPNVLKNVPTLVEIVDPVAGYTYIMDDVARVAHRIQLVARPQPARPTAVRQPGAAARQPALPSFVNGPPPGSGGQIGSGQPPAARQPAPRSQSSSQDLGTQVIDGVQVQGTRTTMIVPAGIQGNDAPISIVHDVWYSAELQLNVLTVTTDPRQGVNTSQIANLSTNEPDPALFFVPTDYTIVDETGSSFTIKWGEQ